MGYCTVFKTSRVAREVERQALEGVDPKFRYRRRQLIKLAMRDGKHCAHCHRPVRFSWESGMKATAHNAATFDHVHTKQQGGRRSLGNGILACYVCNNLRGAQSIPKFLRRLEGVGGDPLKLRQNIRKRKHLKAEAKRGRNNVRSMLRTMGYYDHTKLLDRSVNWILLQLSSWSRCAIIVS